MSVELPKDAEGREIPLDTETLYDKNGERLDIYAWEYRPKFKRFKWKVHFLFDESGDTCYPDEYFLTTPDTWEKLLEDLDRAIGTPRPDNFDSMTCGYFNSVGKNCQECKKRNGFDSSYCNKVAWKNILSRIRKLRGEGE